MPTSSAEQNPVDRLAEEFAERLRRGERPSLAEYTTRYPDLADEIRELFPALVIMEQLKPPADATGVEGSAILVGTRLQALGDYRILREIGRGGMGVVYEAEQLSLGRHVALKVLPAQALVNPTYLERFQREAKAAAKLHHTNIVPVFGVGEHQGVHFYAMQYISGEGLDRVLHDLRQLRQQGADVPGGPPSAPGTEFAASVAVSLLSGHFTSPAVEPAAGETASLLPPEASHATLSGDGSGGGYYRSVARLGVQVADALAYAHRQGILHRDIKPSNLLLDAQGTVWVTDFGLAKAEGSDELTATGDIVGTVRYMAPERFDGQSLPQGDVYGLGLTLYELLTLRPAFEGDNRHRLIKRMLHEPPVSPRRLDPGIPRDLETVVLKCLARDPAERYAGAEALAEDLRRFLADRPIKARRTPWYEHTWRWCRRNPVVAGLLAVVAGLLIVVATVSTFAALQLTAALTKTQTAEREARLREADALVGQAHGIRYSRQMGQRFDALAALARAAAIGRELGQPPAWFDGLRDEAVACLALPDLRVDRSWDGWPAGSWQVAFDADLERYARADRQGNVSVRRMTDDAELWNLPPSGPGETLLRMSPDGRFLAVEASWNLRVWDLAGREPVRLLELTAAEADISSDSRWLAAKYRDGFLGLYDLAAGKEVRRMRGPPHPNGLAFHPFKRLLAVSADTKTQVIDLESGKPCADLRQPGNCLAWSPDGEALAVESGAVDDVVIHIWDVFARRETARLEGCRSGGIKIRFDHSGDLLVSNGWENRLRLWDPHTGKQVFSTPAATPLRLHFSADDRLLGPEISGARLRMWEVADGHEYRTLALDQQGNQVLNVWSTALSPDGRLLAVGTEKGIHLWDAARGSAVGFVGCGLVTGLAFEPSGALLAHGPGGLRRWPLREDPMAPGSLRLGPPEGLPVPGSPHNIALSRDGSVVASAQGWGAFVLHQDQPGRPVRLAPHADTRYVAVSPDGRWVATGSHNDMQTKVWDARTGQLAATLPTDRFCRVVFSPDGNWLATATDRTRLWAVGSWHEGPTFEGVHPAFAPDGKLLALETGKGVIRLLNPADGREYVRLEDPNHDRARTLFFSADGARLVVPSNDSQSVHVWDLWKLRAGLRRLDLDWAPDPYPQRPPTGPRTADTPLRLRVDPGDLEDLSVLGARPTPEHLVHVILANSLTLAFDPFNFKAYRQRGRACGYLAGAFGRSDLMRPAIADYSAALALMPADDPGRVDLLRRRAGNRLLLGEYDRALVDIREAGRLDPATDQLTRFLLASLLAAQAARRPDRTAALRALREAVVIDPGYEAAHNNLAWLLLTGPRARGDVAEALRHAREAVERSGEQPVYLNTLGLALYRSGRAAEAVPVLEKGLALGGGRSDGYDLFLLALCHARLGDAVRAKQCFDRAVGWCAEHKNLPPRQVEELKGFRAEAEKALTEKQSDQPRPGR
jgi:serine/threonine protein kinase/WD40 repeat protein/tetratricopeptide (TPR) repeat protein